MAILATFAQSSFIQDTGERFKMGFLFTPGRGVSLCCICINWFLTDRIRDVIVVTIAVFKEDSNALSVGYIS